MKDPGASANRSRGRGTLAFASVFLAAALVHVLVWWQYRTTPFAATYVADALSYDRWAARIAEHGLAAEGVFHQSPLFAILLAGVYKIVPDVYRAAFSLSVQMLLAALAVALLVPLGRRFMGSLRAGVAAAILALLHGAFVFYAMKLLPVPIALATQGLGLLSLALARDDPRLRTAIGAGTCWGLACLARSEMLLFVPVAIGVLALARPDRPTDRRRVARAASYLAGVVLLVAPVTVHNLRQGDLVWIASSGGENLFIGNQRGADGGYTAMHPAAGDIFSQRAMARRLAEQAEGRPLDASEVSSHWRRRALEEIGSAPGEWVSLELRKLSRMLHPGDPTDIYSLALERSQYLGILHALPLNAWSLVLLAAVGFVVIVRRRRFGAWPLIALAGLHALVLLAFFVDARLRLPWLYVLCPFAGLAVAEGLEHWRAKRGRIAIAIVTIAVVGTIAVGFATSRPTPRDVVRLASVLSTQQRLDESLAVLAPHLASDPDPLLLDQAGWVNQKRGDYEAARDHYRSALAKGLPPARARQTRTRLAMVYEKLDRADLAAAEHDAAVSSGHANAGTFFERGMFRLRRGDRAGAVADLRRAVELDSRWPAPREALESLGAGPGP